jgi:hypothetical protein
LEFNGCGMVGDAGSIDLCEGGIDVCGERLLRVRPWQCDWSDKIGRLSQSTQLLYKFYLRLIYVLRLNVVGQEVNLITRTDFMCHLQASSEASYPCINA